MESAGLSAEQREWAEFIRAESSRLAEIVDTLLDISSIDRGGLELTLEPVRLIEIIDVILASVSRASDRHHIVLVGDSSLEVLADREKLTQVLRNLVDNAVKYSPEGGRVTIACERSGDLGRLSVSDEGLGIPPEERERVFARFHRIDRPEAARIRGSGLGLYLVREFVREMGGDVEVVQSEPGATTLAFTLPLGADAAEVAA